MVHSPVSINSFRKHFNTGVTETAFALQPSQGRLPS